MLNKDAGSSVELESIPEDGRWLNLAAQWAPPLVPWQQLGTRLTRQNIPSDLDRTTRLFLD
jgi:hypothetical protein